MEVDDLVVVQSGRWMRLSSGEWEFKVDTLRQGRCLRVAAISSLRQLELKVRELYKLEEVSAKLELSFVFEDLLAQLYGTPHGPTFLCDEKQFRCFKSLSLSDKSVNLYAVINDREVINPLRICNGERECDPIAGVGGSKSGYFSGLMSSVMEATVMGVSKEIELIDRGEYETNSHECSDELLLREVEKVEELNGILSSDASGNGDDILLAHLEDVEAGMKAKKIMEEANMSYSKDLEESNDSWAEDSQQEDDSDAIKRVFRFHFKRNEKDYMVAECYDKKSCDWRVYAHQVGNTDEFEIRKVQLKHFCNVETRRKFSKHATARVLASLLRSKYAKAHCGPRASEVPGAVLSEHNVRVSYWKGWKAKELAIETAQGTEETSYAILPVYLHVLKLANPGTIYHLETELDEVGDDRFKYVFLTLGACVRGLPFVRRVVVLDGTHLFGKYRGVLLTASCQDANFQILPIAFGVVDSENDKSWEWFLKKLGDIIKDGDDLTYVTDRNQSILKVVPEVYPKCHHGACLVHVKRNVEAKYKKKSGLPSLVWTAGSKFRVRDFNIEYERIKKRSINCWKYLEDIGVENWSRAHFKGERYNMLSSNIAESMNRALIPARGSPIVALLEFIRTMVARWFHLRRKKISRTVGDIPIGVERELLKRFNGGLGMEVLTVGVWDFEICSKEGEQFHVLLEHNTCSCLEFQKLNIPCVHAMAAAHDRYLEYRTLVGEMHRISMWVPAVAGSILPVRDPAEVTIPDEIRLMCLSPPKSKRPAGRPPTLRIRSASEGTKKSKQANKCGRCGYTGHNRVTCKNPIG